MMNNSLKGALFSGLVFPGLGQVVLKHYKRGIVLMFTVFAILMVIVIKAVQDALTVLEMIELEGGVVDMQTITDAATQAASTFDSGIYNLGFWLVVICWIFGILDAYKIGKKMDLEGNGESLGSGRAG
jgi:TM2 domain-containing membrane protein YozV